MRTDDQPSGQLYPKRWLSNPNQSGALWGGGLICMCVTMILFSRVVTEHDILVLKQPTTKDSLSNLAASRENLLFLNAKGKV